MSKNNINEKIEETKTEGEFPGNNSNLKIEGFTDKVKASFHQTVASPEGVYAFQDELINDINSFNENNNFDDSVSVLLNYLKKYITDRRIKRFI